MKVDLAGKVDYWVGIPICFCLSLFDKLKKFFIIREKKECLYKKIMFLELSEMGSAILGYSAIKKTKELYPNAEFYFLIFKENAESVYILDMFLRENVFVIRSKNLWVLFIDTVKVLMQIRKERIDVIIDMELFSRFSAILSYLSRAVFRMGFYRFSLEGLYRGSLYTHRVMYNPYLHIGRNFLALISSLGFSYKNTPSFEVFLTKEKIEVPRIEQNNFKKEELWRKIKQSNRAVVPESKLVVLNLGLGENLPLRKWPLENYITLAESLMKDEKIFVVLVSLNFQPMKILRDLMNSARCINLIEKLEFKQLLVLFSIAKLLITHDSGMANIASLTEISLINFFGPETPVLYEPLSRNETVIYKHLACSPCFSAHNHRRSLCKDNLCLKLISVEEIYELAKKILSMDV